MAPKIIGMIPRSPSSTCYYPHLIDNAQAAASKAGGAVSVEYVTDPVAIAEAGIMATPALLVNGKVVSQGKVLAQSEIEELL